MSLLHIIELIQPLAQSSISPASKPAAPGPPIWADPQQFIWVLLALMVVYMLFNSSRSKKNEQKERDNMLKNLKRGDRVRTIGGMLGAVVDVRDNEVVLKVDESTNTKIRFGRDAISRVLVEEDAAKNGAAK